METPYTDEFIAEIGDNIIRVLKTIFEIGRAHV